ncbi:MAG: hypothetical protein U5K71_16995 [Gracilimonas sp.]|nr:hypothetical protein [Gracilimonas sp.]
MICKGEDNPQTITVDTGKEVTAIFERRDYDLTVTIEGEGTVAEEVVQAKTTSHPYETLVQLTATPSTGWVFSHWEAILTGEENPSTIEINEAKNVTAVFIRDYFGISYSYEGEGTVSEVLQDGNVNEEGDYA